jgi:uncharacterized protein YkwD
MLIGARTSIAHWIYALIAALLSAAVTLLLISVVETENNTASAQDVSSGGSVPTCEGGSISLNAYEARSYELHNQTRESNNLATLCISEILTQAARSHSQEMIDKGYFDHNSYNGESYSARLESSGYNSYEQVGENIAWGSGSLASPENIFQSWMESSGHRENILNPDYREVGIGTATGECEGYSGCTMYTADFGLRQSSAPEEGADIPQETNTPQERADTPQRDEITQDSNATRLNLYQYILRLLHSLGF